MALTTLKVPPGISSGSVKNIPEKWDAAWFRRFITNFMMGGDVRNAIAGTGITITGNLASPFATISSAGGSGVTQIVAGTNVTISPVGGTGAVTINATGGGGFAPQLFTASANQGSTVAMANFITTSITYPAGAVVKVTAVVMGLKTNTGNSSGQILINGTAVSYGVTSVNGSFDFQFLVIGFATIGAGGSIPIALQVADNTGATFTGGSNLSGGSYIMVERIS
jgi:hypothetical protein